jgi:flagellar L-ring protein precursor FlgH
LKALRISDFGLWIGGRAALLALGLAAVGVSSAQSVRDDNPGSLWPKTYVNPLLDRTAKQVGDVVTILISESSIASFDASTKGTKTDSTTVDKGLGPILQQLIPALGTGATSSVDGKGSTTQTGKVTARMAALVKATLPNGTLLIEGTRQVQVNKQVQTFRLTGIVRRDDIRSDNTVLSESLAEAVIFVDGKGMIADRQKRGILTRLIDWIF